MKRSFQDDFAYLLGCVETHADKFPVPSHILSLVTRLRASPPPSPAGEGWQPYTEPAK